jgi:1-acyl-sn-glycerol-3-phosphate acyltransferase
MLDPILRKCARGWRVVATGLLIAGIALVVVATVAVGAPWIRLTDSDPARRTRRVRRVVRGTCVRFLRWGQRLGVLRLYVEGAETLRGPGRIVVANHPTMIDAVVLLSLLDDGVCITRRKHWDKPVMRQLIHEAAFPFHEDGAAVVDACTRRIEEGASVVLFPEGTRSPLGGLSPFARGAAHVALRTGSELVPVVMTCDPPTFRKDAPWYRPMDRPFDVRVRVQEPIAVDPELLTRVPRPVAARQLTSQLREVFEKRLARARA